MLQTDILLMLGVGWCVHRWSPQADKDMQEMRSYKLITVTTDSIVPYGETWG